MRCVILCATLIVYLVQITPTVFGVAVNLGGGLDGLLDGDGGIGLDGDGDLGVGGSAAARGGVSNSIKVNAPRNRGTINIDLKAQGKGGVIGHRNRQSGNGLDVATRQHVRGGGGAVIGLGGAGGLSGAGGTSFAVDPSDVLDDLDELGGGGGGGVGIRGDGGTHIQLVGGARLAGDGRPTRVPRNAHNVLINPIYVQSNPNVDASTNVRVRNAIDASARGRGARGGRAGISVDGGVGLGGGGRLGGGGSLGGGGVSLGGSGGGGGGGLGLGSLLLPVAGALGGSGGGVLGQLGTGLLGGPGGGLLGPGGGVRGLLGADADGLQVGLDGDVGAQVQRGRRRRRRGGRTTDRGVVGNLLNGLLRNTT